MGGHERCAVGQARGLAGGTLGCPQLYRAMEPPQHAHDQMAGVGAEPGWWSRGHQDLEGGENTRIWSGLGLGSQWPKAATTNVEGTREV